MIDARNPNRTSPRQAIVAMFEPVDADWASNLSVHLLLDVLGALVAVNGATLAVGCSSIDHARPVAELLPAGVDLIVPPVGEKRSAASSFVRQFAARGFERLILVAADTIGLSPRILTTALSVLMSEQVVFGIGPGKRAYLLGLRVGTKAHELDILEALTNAEPLNAPGIRVDPRRRLRDIASWVTFVEATEGHEKHLMRTLSNVPLQAREGST